MAFKNKNNKLGYTFLAKPFHVLRHKSYRSLNAHSRMLLEDISMQWNGANNGDFTVAFKIMKERGWKSESNLYKCLKDLLENRFIELTRQGGRNKCSLYAVTWLPIDECGGKLDVRPTRTPSNNFKNN